MSTLLEGSTDSKKYRIGIVAAKWNSFITDNLLKGALETLKNKGVPEDRIITARCPGAFEIPFTAKKLIDNVDGIITLGAVIRGDTPHFDYVCDAVTRGITDLNLSQEKPIVYGVLTTDNVTQAQQRSGFNDKEGNKGAEASLALLTMLNLGDQISRLQI